MGLLYLPKSIIFKEENVVGQNVDIVHLNQNIKKVLPPKRNSLKITNNSVYFKKIVMTFTVTPDLVYFAMCFVLLILQVIQYSMIRKSKRDMDEVWTQLGIIITTVGIKIKEIETKIEKDEKSK
jgi:hypothetical protein